MISSIKNNNFGPGERKKVKELTSGQFKVRISRQSGSNTIFQTFKQSLNKYVLIK